MAGALASTQGVPVAQVPLSHLWDLPLGSVWECRSPLFSGLLHTLIGRHFAPPTTKLTPSALCQGLLSGPTDPWRAGPCPWPQVTALTPPYGEA